ncbi:MAG TPA: hypothetical protein VLH09_01520, partial [Bryobacteraceae bacterium]|nr:hypothetical protein [Bryobacteraceae bacterium]
MRVFVADDSRSRADRELNRAVLRSAASRHSFEIQYAGREEKLRYAEALLSGGDLFPEVVHFALFGLGDGTPTMGANRNAILLQTQGSLVLCVDDDTVCQVGQAPDLPEPGLLKLGGEDE